MKKLLALFLCVLTLLSIPTMAVAASGYSTTSNLNVDLEYPSSDCYYATPQRAEVKASKTNGSIYFMPTPKDGNGVLGTVANGTEVTIYAEKSGYYFFGTKDGRMGWNGKKFFTLLGLAEVGYLSNNGVFYFDSGASLKLPSGFILTDEEQDAFNAYVTTSFTNLDQSMDLTLTEIATGLYSQRGTDLLTNLYLSLKGDYPKPTYDSKKDERFDLSGYSGDYIYYFEGILSNQVIYLVKMFYPTRNRSICDQYVKNITASFSDNLILFYPSPAVNLPADPVSPYAVALKENLLYGVSYNDWEKKDIINDTYYARKDADGKRQSWYTSSWYDDLNTGYRINLYYADGLLFFADAYHIGERSSVTFYFWGNQLLCVHDLRDGDKQLRFAGSDTYNAIVNEFGDVYAKAG